MAATEPSFEIIFIKVCLVCPEVEVVQRVDFGGEVFFFVYDIKLLGMEKVLVHEERIVGGHEELAFIEIRVNEVIK
jgi:signal transduction histidine kinase